MSNIYATQFSEILPTLLQNSDLLSTALLMIQSEPVAGKVTEGGNRISLFRAILADLVEGKITFQQAIDKTYQQLSEPTSIYAGNGRVFALGWSERLVRTQLSRFYNQAVLKQLTDTGETECFVPHSREEKSDSPCSLSLAGGTHSVKTLYDRLVDSYALGSWTQVLKVPNHPHCTHVVTPVSK